MGQAPISSKMTICKETMRIKVLGTRGEVESSAPLHSRHSGILVDGTIMLDLGERDFLEYRPKYIFITHLHPDHAFFVEEPYPISTPIYAPEEYLGETSVRTLSSQIKGDSHLITPIPTLHSHRVKSVAYLVESGECRLLYTGDMIWIEERHHRLFAGLDLVITDGSFMRRGGLVRRDSHTGQPYGHAGIPDLIELFRGFTRHIMFVHFGSWFYRDIVQAQQRLRQLGESQGVTVHTGYDGLELDLHQLGGLRCYSNLAGGNHRPR